MIATTFADSGLLVTAHEIRLEEPRSFTAHRTGAACPHGKPVVAADKVRAAPSKQ